MAYGRPIAQISCALHHPRPDRPPRPPPGALSPTLSPTFSRLSGNDSERRRCCQRSCAHHDPPEPLPRPLQSSHLPNQTCPSPTTRFTMLIWPLPHQSWDHVAPRPTEPPHDAPAPFMGEEHHPFSNPRSSAQSACRWTRSTARGTSTSRGSGPRTTATS